MTPDRPETAPPEHSKIERKLESLLRVLRKGQGDRVRAVLAGMSLEKSRIMRAVTQQLMQLAEANDSCVVGLASALSERVRNTAACPDAAKAIASAAKPLFDNRHWPEAADLLKLAVELDPDQPPVKRQLARALGNMGERSEAVAVLLPLLVANPAMVSAATILARQLEAYEMADIARTIAPLALAHSDANPASTAQCIQVLIRLMCFDEAAGLLPRLGSLEASFTAKAAFDIGINTNDAPLVSRAIEVRRWLPAEQSERDVWLSRLALLQADRVALAAPFDRLSATGGLGLLGDSCREAGQALGRYAEAFSGIWTLTQRLHIAKLVPNLFQPEETLESLSGARVLVIARAELGDEIYPLELLDRIRQTFASCTIVVDRRIAGLVARNRDDLVVVGTEKLNAAPSDNAVPHLLRRHLCPEVWSEIARFDKVLLIGDLRPLLIRTEHDLPHRLKTLDASPELRTKWREELGRFEHRPRVGLFWRSGRVNYMRSSKYTDLKDWVPVLKCCQGPVVSLQFGTGVSEEIAAFGKARIGENVRVVEMPGLDTRDDLESVAALMCELDLIITIPGTTMHLAGALGRPTLAVSHPSEVLKRTRMDGITGTWSPSVKVVSGPSELAFNGAILAASKRLQQATQAAI